MYVFIYNLYTYTGSAVGVKDVGLELDDCAVTSVETHQVSGNASVHYVSFPQSIKANGWSITTSQHEATQPRDPTRFLLHFALPRTTSRRLADCLHAHNWWPEGEAVRESEMTRVELRKIVIDELRYAHTGSLLICNRSLLICNRSLLICNRSLLICNRSHLTCNPDSCLADLSKRGGGWCRWNVCDKMSDTDLTLKCLPPHMLVCHILDLF
jgi:hypothetical protein